MGRSGVIQILAKRGDMFRHVMPEGIEHSAVRAAKDYPRIQQWLREFYCLVSKVLDPQVNLSKALDTTNIQETVVKGILARVAFNQKYPYSLL